VICFDSWVWLEATLGGTDEKRAREALERGEREGSVVAATVLAEVYYVLDREKGTEVAEKTMETIHRFENTEVLPVTADVAIRGAQLRRKYYSQADDRTPSYADTIHLALAEMITECDLLITGDADFEDVTEVQCLVF
jgi:predicted nucleic acid-binding protein